MTTDILSRSLRDHAVLSPAFINEESFVEGVLMNFVLSYLAIVPLQHMKHSIITSNCE
jgi:hypothetical protein